MNPITTAPTTLHPSTLRLNYFVVDDDDQVLRIPARQFERIWHGDACVDELESDGLPVQLDKQLRLLTVLGDRDWHPIVTFLMRTRLSEGRLLVADRYHLYRTLAGRGKTGHEGALVKHHLSGWPADWQSQLAVAMDCPAADFTRVSIGGPLVMADLWGMEISAVVRHFEQNLK